MTTIGAVTDLRTRVQLALGTGYRVGEEIGRGGMSRVFAARDLTLGREIVVKTLPPELAGDLSVERFKREIHFAASLQHPHIVPVHAAGDVDGLPYYTMPRVDGESLRDRLNRAQRLPLAEVLTVMRDVGRALAYAHRRGLVHRDIKPENILLAEGMAVVTDFGIAKAIAESRLDEKAHEPHGQSTVNGLTLTAAGTYLGTPNYVAPEQMAAGSAIDHRADLFAFGVVAYELLCGTTPYSAQGQSSGHIAKFASRPDNITAQRLDVPPAISQLVMQCLEVDPEGRPQSTDDVVRKLDAVMSATPLAPVGDDPAVTRRAFGWYAVAFVAVSALAWAAMVGLGLPDWVLPGTMIIMALGLPVVTTAALARRAAHASSLERATQLSRVGWLFTPGPLTMRLAQTLTWRRVFVGGGSSLASFAILIAGFMASRSSGVGPAASLLASGHVQRNQAVLVSEFTSAAQDSSIARIAAEAVSIGLRESNVVQVLSATTVGEALRRMRRDPAEPLTLEVAREVAAREGVNLIVNGDVVREEGERVAMVVRLIAADSGNVLAVHQATSAGTRGVLDMADQSARALRSKIGESLKRVRATPPLARVTTSSLEALDLYTQALVAEEIEGDRVRARELLGRALQLDSSFAIAWRKLAVIVPQPANRLARQAAFRHRNNASESERLLIEADHLWTGVYDRPRAIATYEEFARHTGVPHNNHAWGLIVLRQFARSESLYRALFTGRPEGTGYNPYHGFLWALMNQGKYRDADSVARVARSRFPNVIAVRYWATKLTCGMKEFADCQAGLDSIVKENPRHVGAIASLSELALMQGQLRRWEQLQSQLAQGQAAPPAITYCCPIRIAPAATPSSPPRRRPQGVSIWVDLVIRQRPDLALLRLDSLERPVNGHGARLYALAGRPDSARAMIARLEMLVPDTTPFANNDAFLGQVGQGSWGLTQARAALAIADRRARDGIALYRASDVHPADGMPVYPCAACAELDLANAFDLAQVRDSAIVFYERFLSTHHYIPDASTPHASRFGTRWWDLINKAWVHERLGELYAEDGNRERAAAHLTSFVELWKDADPELQPRVTAARNRLAQLKAS